MTATTARPLPPSPDALVERGLRAVYCQRCANPRPLALVGTGTLVVRFKNHEYRVDNITAGQRVWAKCGPCGRQQRIVIPN